MRKEVNECITNIVLILSLRIQFECGKMQTRKTPNTDTFYAVIQEKIALRS